MGLLYFKRFVPVSTKADSVLTLEHYLSAIRGASTTACITLISGFRRDVDEICGLLGYYTASYGNYLPTFRDNVSVPSSRVKIPSRKSES
jgi:hypothetical protein